MTRKEITQLARQLRKNQTEAERRMWAVLRNRRFLNLKFYRQYPIVYESYDIKDFLFYIADFYCHSHRLVVEIDGPIHNFTKKKDLERTQIMGLLGIRVVRFRNSELEKMNVVRRKLMEFITTHPV